MEAGPPGSPPGSPSTERRVLVVDDDDDVAGSLVDALELLGYEARAAQDGTRAIELARGFEPHAVLLDLGLSRMDGVEVGRRLRALPGRAQLRLVAVTGSDDERDVARTREAGFEVHLVKPIDLATLGRVLATLFDG